MSVLKKEDVLKALEVLSNPQVDQCFIPNEKGGFIFTKREPKTIPHERKVL